MVDPAYRQYAEKGFAGVTATLTYDGDDLLVGGVCMGTGVSDYDYYINLCKFWCCALGYDSLSKGV